MLNHLCFLRRWAPMLRSGQGKHGFCQKKLFCMLWQLTRWKKSKQKHMDPIVSRNEPRANTIIVVDLHKTFKSTICRNWPFVIPGGARNPKHYTWPHSIRCAVTVLPWFLGLKLTQIGIVSNMVIIYQTPNNMMSFPNAC